MLGDNAVWIITLIKRHIWIGKSGTQCSLLNRCGMIPSTHNPPFFSVCYQFRRHCRRSHWGSCFLEGNLSWLRDCFVFISSGCLLARQAQDGARYFFEYKKCICPKFQSGWEHGKSENSIKNDQTAKRVVKFLKKREKSWFWAQSQLSLDLLELNPRETWEIANL